MQFSLSDSLMAAPHTHTSITTTRLTYLAFAYAYDRGSNRDNDGFPVTVTISAFANAFYDGNESSAGAALKTAMGQLLTSTVRVDGEDLPYIMPTTLEKACATPGKYTFTLSPEILRHVGKASYHARKRKKTVEVGLAALLASAVGM